MADTKLTDLTALTGAQTANTDRLYIVDISAGTSGSKSLTISELGLKLETILSFLTQTAADGLYSVLAHTHTFASLTSKPTTLAGYGIVDAAALSHTHAADDVTSGVFAIGRLATGTPDGTKFVRDDGTLAVPTAGAAAAGSLTGTTLASNVVTSSLTSVGTLATLTVTAAIVGSVTGSSGSTTGNAATATALATARTINGVAFDGTGNITVTAAAGTLTGATLASNVLASSLTSVGTLAALTVTAAITGSVTGSSGSTTGNAATATALATARTINGTSFDGTGNITVTSAAGTLTGATLASGVTASSLTSVGTITSGVWTGTAIAIANGGTGQTTAANAINALLPTQTSNSGQYLTTDGSVASWATVSASDATKLPLAGGTMTGSITLGVTNLVKWTSVGIAESTVSGTAEINSGTIGTFRDLRARQFYVNTTDMSLIAPGSHVMALQRSGLSYFKIGTGSTYIGQLILRKETANAGITWATDSWDYLADTNSEDLSIMRSAANIAEVNTGTKGIYATLVTAEQRFAAPTSANGQFLSIKSLTELTTIAAAATTDTTIQMPANSIVLGVSVRVTTVIPTATTFDVGDSGLATRFSTASVAVAANSTDPGTKAGAYYNAGALSVRFTMNGGTPAANTGRVRVTVYYLQSTVPTS